MKIRFSDDVEIETSGKLRKSLLADGWYVLGEGIMVPCDNEKAAEELLARLKAIDEK